MSWRSVPLPVSSLPASPLASLWTRLFIVAGFGVGLVPWPVFADGVCERAKAASDRPDLVNAGWCRMQEKGPAGQTVYIYADQNHPHRRQRTIFMSYDRSTDYKRYLLDCDTIKFAEVAKSGNVGPYNPITLDVKALPKSDQNKLWIGIFESVCLEKNTLIPRPFLPTVDWPKEPQPPPASL